MNITKSKGLDELGQQRIKLIRLRWLEKIKDLNPSKGLRNFSEFA